MPKKDGSFRIGCGRYLQGENFIQKSGCEFLRFSDKVVIIGDTISFNITKEDIAKSAKDNGVDVKFVLHDGTCNEDDAIIIAEETKNSGYGLVVGVGGGVICDFVKIVAYYAKTPCMNIPTSSATCACFTPLSVRYTRDGETVGSMHFTDEVNEVLVDTVILKNQPIRLLLAGVFDAMAKFVEIKQRFSGKEPIGAFSLGLDYAYMLAKGSYDVLVNNTEQAIEDMKKDSVTPVLDQIFFTTICVTGVISGIARGSNQCAIAHKFYETTRTLFSIDCRKMLHGEIVGVGLLLQNMFNGEKQNNTALLRFMKNNGMPYTPELLNITVNEQTKKQYASKIIASSAINDNDESEVEKYLTCQEDFFNGIVE